MNEALSLLRGFHIACGLLAFWFPLFARKGGFWHRRMGQVFRWSAFGVLSAAALAIVLEVAKLSQAGQGPAAQPEAWAFLVFLAYLSLVTAVMLSHGMAVLKAKRDLRQLNRPWRRAQAQAAIAASLLIVLWAVYWNPANAVLLYALSPLGLLIGRGILTALGQVSAPRHWLLEHLGAMLGCGIAYHTAFTVFGFSRLFGLQLSGWLAVLPWILPTLLGTPAIILWSRHYRSASPAAQPGPSV